jgi:hypothetical protein
MGLFTAIGRKQTSFGNGLLLPGPGLVPARAHSALGAWLDRGVVVAVLLASSVALSLNVADPDLWGHVQYGRDALTHGLPLTTTYSYVAEGYPWINHEILAEYALAIVNDLAGGPGLLIAKWLLGLGVIGAILFRALRQGASIIAACSLTLLVAITLGNHWSLRPQIASYVSFTLLLALLSWCFQGWEGKWWLPLLAHSPTHPLTARAEAGGQSPPYDVSRLKRLWLAPPLFMLWTNAHGGFLAGLCIYLAYLGLRGLEAICNKGRAADGLVLRFTTMGLAAIAATFINPYGLNFHRWLYDDLKVPRPEIVEWRAPEFFDAQFAPFWLLLTVSVLAIVLTRRSRDFTHVVILGLIIWQALTHHRHIAFYAIAAGWWLPQHVDSLFTRLGGSQQKNEAAALSPAKQWGFAALLVGAIGISVAQLATRLTTLKVERSEYPIAAFDYIAKRGLTGKMVCTFNWAQYALAAFGPRETGDEGILVQVDGRCRTSYSQEMLDQHFDFLIGKVDASQRYRGADAGPFDPEAVLKVGEPDLVLISRLQKPSVEVMERQAGRWTLLYQDELAQLWGRASQYDEPSSRSFLAPTDRHIGNETQAGFALWPAIPKHQHARKLAPFDTSRALLSGNTRDTSVRDIP